VRGAFSAGVAVNFFRKVNFLVRPAPEPGEATGASRRLRASTRRCRAAAYAETSILSALLRYRRFSAANFVKQNFCARALECRKRRARGGTERRGRYTQN
jgi:hypothetical protein